MNDLQQQKNELLEYGVNIDQNQIKGINVAPYISEIIFQLWQNKNHFVSRETIIEIRQKYYRGKNYRRYISSEISRIIKLINKIFTEQQIPLTLVSASGVIMLYDEEIKR